MTRICHITTSHHAFDTRIFKHECVSLASAGYEVCLVAPHPIEETVDRVRILPVARPGSLYERIVTTPARAVRLAESTGADLFHFHDPELVPWMRRLARRLRAPVVWDAHESHGFTIPQFNSFRIRPVSRAAGWAFDRMETRACASDFAAVVTVSPRLADRYAASGVKTCWAGNFPEISGIPFPPLTHRNRRPRFVSTGGQFLDRGVFEILEGFALLYQSTEAELAFWGEFTPPGLADEIRTRARDLCVPPECLLFGGPYPWKVLIQELLPTAWAGFVLFNPAEPNDAQGLPNRFFECWANAVPVIATADTEVGRLVRAEAGGFVVDRNDPVAIAAALASLAADRDLVETMGAAGRRAVEARYNWEAAFHNILALYAELGIRP